MQKSLVPQAPTTSLSLLGMRASRFMRRVSILNLATSERTGDIIQLSARRFRRTRGTNLGRKGVSAFIIAEALDQSDTQNVIVYNNSSRSPFTLLTPSIFSACVKSRKIGTSDVCFSDKLPL
jgi:hypothetical protein